MTTRTPRTRLLAVVAVAVLALFASGCGSSDSDDKKITLGFIPSWTDGTSTAHLWKKILEDKGYDVELKELSDAAPLYTAVAQGDVDVAPSMWPEATQIDYWNKYKDDIEDVDTYYDNAKLTFAVPKYTDIDSIEDLKSDPKRFDGKIIGIEPGAGLTKTTKGKVIPQYGLGKDFKLVTSSTTAMTTELQSAIKDKKDIVVTLWRPFWANAKFPIKDLKDPKGALGKSEGLHVLGRTDFEKDFPEVAKMMKKFKMDDKQYGSLEDLTVNKYGKGKEDQAAKAWLKDNPDYLASLGG